MKLIITYCLSYLNFFFFLDSTCSYTVWKAGLFSPCIMYNKLRFTECFIFILYFILLSIAKLSLHVLHICDLSKLYKAHNMKRFKSYGRPKIYE